MAGAAPSGVSPSSGGPSYDSGNRNPTMRGDRRVGASAGGRFPQGTLAFKQSAQRLIVMTELSRQRLLEVFSEVADVYLIRIFPATTGFAVLVTEKDADKILNERMIERLKEKGVQVRLPPDWRVKRSVFVRGLDPIVGENDERVLKEEIERVNRWAKVSEIIRMRDPRTKKFYTHVLKIQFSDVGMCERACQEGLLAFSMRVAPDQIKREEYIPLLTCFKCYAYEAHIARDCPRQTQVCGECAQEGHNYRECKSENKRCVNCNGPHRALAMACPIKRTCVCPTIHSSTSTTASQRAPGIVVMRVSAATVDTFRVQIRIPKQFRRFALPSPRDVRALSSS